MHTSLVVPDLNTWTYFTPPQNKRMESVSDGVTQRGNKIIIKDTSMWKTRFGADVSVFLTGRPLFLVQVVIDWFCPLKSGLWRRALLFVKRFKNPVNESSNKLVCFYIYSLGVILMRNILFLFLLKFFPFFKHIFRYRSLLCSQIFKWPC